VNRQLRGVAASITLFLQAVLITTSISATSVSAHAKPLTPAEHARLTTILRQADADFRDDVMPFWTRYTWDDQYGGFMTAVDRQGNPGKNTDKYLIMQARMIWTLASAHAYGIRNRGYLPLAGKAAKYVIHKMWDPKYQGFYLKVARDGTPSDTNKFTYCQEFAIYALAKYAQVSGDREALAWAEKTYALVKEKGAMARLDSMKISIANGSRFPTALGWAGWRRARH